LTKPLHDACLVSLSMSPSWNERDKMRILAEQVGPSKLFWKEIRPSLYTDTCTLWMTRVAVRPKVLLEIIQNWSANLSQFKFKALLEIIQNSSAYLSQFKFNIAGASIESESWFTSRHFLLANMVNKEYQQVSYFILVTW